MRVSILKSIDGVSACQWNSLSGSGYPFLRHEFLAALEHHQCVGEKQGWIPNHIVIFDERDTLLGAVPLYQKHNSYGEFVFDWSWAEAYERNGLPYYPKLVAAAPYTPATGPRLLLADIINQEEIADLLIKTALELAQKENLSSLHWLFTDEHDTSRLEKHGLMRRSGYQFHWVNRNYRDFEAFLGALSSRKRKKIRRERRYVQEAGVELKVIHGNEASSEQLRTINHFYQSIYQRKWGFPTLNLGFFEEIAATMGDSIVLVLAYKDEQPVAGAFNLRGDHALYGRYWGCSADYHSLHFETCYYQGIEYCIRHKLQLFEPGAQGEHKISRGFLPTPTWSAHWIADERFRAAIQNFLNQESELIQENIQALNTHSPYRETTRNEIPSSSARTKASRLGQGAK